MRMKLAFEGPFEDAFHGGDVDDPGGGRTDHFGLELADEVEGDDRVDHLSGVAI